MRSRNGFLIFFIFLFIHLAPLFSVDLLLTLDGPSHLYNAKIFNELLSENTFLADYYEINTELVPNYLGHLILSFFLLFSSPIIALKLIHIIYVLGISIAFRKLILALNPESGRLSVLIFPLVYSAPFISGFYNFSLALIFLLWTLYFWFNNKGNNTFWFYVKLGMLLLLTFFSHSFTFAVLCLSLGVIIIGEKGVKNIKSWIFEGLKVFAAALLPLCLAMNFVLSRTATNSYLSGDELWNQIKNFEFIYSYSNETSFWVLMYVLFSLVGSVLFKEKRYLSIASIAIILFGLYFYLPDGVGYASVFSVRTLLLFFLFLVLWLALQKRNRLLQGVLVLVLFFYQNYRMSELKEWMVIKNNRAKEIVELSKLIPENSTILPIRTLNTWQYFHVSNFLGTDKPQLILENYEAAHDYFPVKWKYNLENKIKKEKLNLDKVNYIIKIGYSNSINEEDKRFIEYAESAGIKVYKSDFIVLYKVVD